MSTPFSSPRLAALFTLDLRSLALFRVLLSLVLLGSLLAHFCDLAAFYSDSGVAPRGWAMALAGDARVSLHWLNGSTLFAATLLLIQIAAALCLLVGWRTRLASVIGFVLWVSLMSRDVYVITPGDSLMAGLLFWSLFLPLSARYSVEHVLANPPIESAQASWASAGLLVQLAAPFFFSALALYTDAPAHASATLHYLLNSDTLTNSLGQWLLTQSELLPTLSRWLIGFSLMLPLLLLSPFFTQATRAIAAVGLLLLNLFSLAVFDLGAFPWASLAALTVLLGARFWDALQRRDESRNAGALHIYYDKKHAFSLLMCRLLQEFLILPRATLAPAQDTARTRSLLQANQSWIVLDAADQATMKWPALVTLLKRSPVFRVLAAPLSLSLFEKPGNALYDLIARRYTSLDRRSDRCTSASAQTHAVSKPWTLISAVVLMLLLLQNFAAVRWLPQALGTLSTGPLSVLQLDTRWQFYSRSELQNDGWLLSVGTLTDGSKMDVSHTAFNGADFNKLPHAAIAADGLRWLMYRERLWKSPTPDAQQHYTQYLCERWNRVHRNESDKQLQQVSFTYMLERTPPPPAVAAAIEQVLLGTYDCH